MCGEEVQEGSLNEFKLILRTTVNSKACLFVCHACLPPPLFLSLAPPLVLIRRQTMRVLNVNKTSRPTTATLATVTKTTEETQQRVRLTNAIKT